MSGRPHPTSAPKPLDFSSSCTAWVQLRTEAEKADAFAAMWQSGNQQEQASYYRQRAAELRAAADYLEDLVHWNDDAWKRSMGRRLRKIRREAAVAQRELDATRAAIAAGGMNPDAWELLKADYLRLEAPAASHCIRRLQHVARERGWSLPSASALRRKLMALDPEVVALRRHGGAAVVARQ